MLNYVWTYLTLVVLFVVQTTLGIYIDVYSIAPDIIFVFAVCYSMYNFPVRSTVLCLVAGILADLYTGSYIGVNALLYMYIGLAISNFAASLIKKNIWTATLGVLTVSVIYHTVVLIVYYVIPGYSSFAFPFLSSCAFLRWSITARICSIRLLISRYFFALNLSG